MNDVIRIGRISSVNPTSGMARVYYPDRDSTTSELSLFGFHREFKLPKVNDQVVVLHLPNDTSSGIILGNFWNEADSPPEQVQYKKDFENGTYEMLKDGNYIIHSSQIILEGESESISLTDLIDMKRRLERLERGLPE